MLVSVARSFAGFVASSVADATTEDSAYTNGGAIGIIKPRDFACSNGRITVFACIGISAAGAGRLAGGGETDGPAGGCIFENAAIFALACLANVDFGYSCTSQR